MNIARVLTVVLVASLGACIEAEPEDVGTDINATTPSGVSGAVLSRATITDVAVSIKWEDFNYKIQGDSEDGTSVVMTLQVVTALPGGHTGWHTHAGPTVAMITSGSVVVYRDDDLPGNDSSESSDRTDGRGREDDDDPPPCTGRVFNAGEAFMDGPDFGTHIARNEGSVNAVVHIMHYLPTASTPLRVDVPAPAGAADCGLPL